MKGFASKTDKKEIDLLEYVRVVVKRKWVLVTFARGPRRARGRPVVHQDAALPGHGHPAHRRAGGEHAQHPGRPQRRGHYRSDYLGTYFNTQLRLLTSRSLAERVAKKLNLGARPEFRGADGSRRRASCPGLKSVITFRWLSGRGRAATPEPRRRRLRRRPTRATPTPSWAG